MNIQAKGSLPRRLLAWRHARLLSGLFLPLVFLAPFLYSFAFCFPRGDDYDGITRAMFLFDLPGGLYEVAREWLSWSGRYTYHFLAVFLGKAAESRLACGLVCALVLFSYGLAFFMASRLAVSGARPVIFALGGLCVLCACHANLPDFYLLTDALTIVLQASLYLLFLAQLLGLWQNRPRLKRRRKLCAISGLLAIGVYEHAALAVFWTMAAALMMVYGFQASGKPGRQKKSLRTELLILAAWLLGGLAFSFLAPGNLQRKISRHVSWEQQLKQLADAPQAWLDFMGGFLHSPWPLTIICLMALLRLSVPVEEHHPEHPPWLCLLPPLVFLAYSVSVTLLHALSDAPLSSQPKLAASLELYASASLGLGLFFLPVSIPESAALKALLRLLFCLALVLTLCLGANFQKCLVNAANGEMLLFADFMKRREAWLERMAASSQYNMDSFGLIGEIINPRARERKLDPEAEAVLAPAFPRQIFPVHMQKGLDQNPGGWPNLWAAWVYGLAALAEASPNPEPVLKAVASGQGTRLEFPGVLAEAGLAGAWLYHERENPNPLFHSDWLVLLADREKRLELFFPALPKPARLLPWPLQEAAWKMLEEKLIFHANPVTSLDGLTLSIDLHPDKGRQAIWLGPATQPASFAQYFFASANGLIYHKISLPACGKF